MDTTTIIVILVGIVVVLVLIGVISSLVRGGRGKARPPESVVEINDQGAERGAAPSGDDDTARDELKARAEEEAREADAAEQEQVARKIDEDLDAAGPDDSVPTGTDDAGQDRRAGRGRHRPGNGQDG